MKMYNYLLIKPNSIVLVHQGQDITLEYIQKCIEGYYEPLYITNNVTNGYDYEGYVNEEGMLNKLPLNHFASEVLEKIEKKPRPIIYGNLLLRIPRQDYDVVYGIINKLKNDPTKIYHYGN